MSTSPNSLQFDERKIIGQTFYREVELEERALKVNREKRTFEIAFSSEFPVRRWYGYEILDHSGKGANLKRLNAGGALLICHDRKDQAGAVVKKTARIDDDKVGRAECRISRSRDDILDDLEDEIRGPASFGYTPLEMVLEKEQRDGVNVYRVTKWEAVEISLESTPADPTVGAGRSLESDEPAIIPDATRVADPLTPTEEERKMPDKEKETPAVTTPAVSEEVTRAQEMVALGEALGDVEMARTMAAEGKTTVEFRAALVAKRKAAEPVVPAEDPQTVAARNGGGQITTVRSRVQLKAFKGDKAEERALNAGHFLRAALFDVESSRQFCRDNDIVLKRAHSESDNETGGFLVPTEFENVMIDLRLEYGVFRRNANVVPMAALRKERPRRTGGLTAYPIGVRGTNRRLTESRKGWDLVGLDAKKWGVLAKYEDELSEDSVISMADDLASEMAFAFTKIEDECGFIGTGTSDYHGITGVIPKLTGLSGTVANIASLAVGTGNLWSELILIDILNMVGKLPSFARRTGQVKWYCSNEFWSTVLVRIALGLGGNALMEIQNEISPAFLGKPVEIVEVMPHVEANSQVCLLYGNLSQAAMFGDRRGMTVKMTDSNDTDFEEDLQAIKSTERFDINVHDVGNASATAGSRFAGPVVGLITAAS